jgi:hypothetical protein
MHVACKCYSFQYGGAIMKAKDNGLSFVLLLAIVFNLAVWVTAPVTAESADLDEASIKAYLEKKVAGDPGSCLVENTKLDIIGIADLVPGQQAEVFYNFEYLLRCNRSKETKNGQGVLKAVRLRNGKWIDRETVGMISQ